MGLAERGSEKTSNPRTESRTSGGVQEIRTSLDRLYFSIKKNGEMALAKIAETYRIPIEKAEEWARILETQNLAKLYYPALGKPRLLSHERHSEIKAKEMDDKGKA